MDNNKKVSRVSVIALLLSMAILYMGFNYIIMKHRSKTDEIHAVISVDGRIEKTINLTSVEKPFEYTLNNGNHTIVFLVEHEAISVKETNCKFKICQKMGRLRYGMNPLVCMPSKVLVSLINKK